jgi:hypothetical protein
MTRPDERHQGQRQLAGLAASGGLFFYVVALGLVVVAGILWTIRFVI